MDVWSTQSLQAAWFVGNMHSTDLRTFFEKVTGLQPTAVQTSQMFAPQPTIVGMAQGNDGVFDHIVQFSSGRVDLRMQPAAGVDTSVADTENHIARLKDRVSAIGLNADVTRLAFVVGLAQEAPNLSATNALMREQIGVDFLGDLDQDFSFRLNRRGHVAGRECNRLCTWSVGQSQTMEITISLQPMMMGQPQLMAPPMVLPMQRELPPAPPRIAAYATIDVNTVPVESGQSFSVEEQRTTFVALADEALRLCRQNCLRAL